MEYHHHHQHKEQQTSAAFSTKLSMKHAYDGVFSNTGKLGNSTGKVEDYREIFSGCQRCSIPILDVPELNEGKVSVDVTRSSRVDYSNIFGGFGDSDCGVSFEDLVAKPKQVTRTTKGEARVPSGQSGHSVLQKEKVVSSSESALESFHGVKQFNMSYNRTNPGSKNGSNGLTHIAELHAVPGYTCLIDENVASSKGENGRPVVMDDSKLGVNVQELIKRDRARRKVVSGPQPSVAAEISSRSNADFRKKSSRNKSISNDMSFDAFGFGVGGSPSSASPVSKLASNVGNNKDISSRSDFGAVRSDFSIGKPGSYSPPSLDEEVDSNSVAATSAAAVRKAIEEAQLKIKIAKQLMERKREGFHSRAKSSSKNGLKAEEKPEVKAAEKRNGLAFTEAQEMCEKKDTWGQAFAKIADHNLMKIREAILYVKSEKESPIHKNPVEQIHSSKSVSTNEDYIVKEVDHRKATGECFEPSIPNEPSGTQQLEQVDNEKKMTVSANGSEMDQKMTGEERFQNSKDSSNQLDACEQVSEVENVELDLNLPEGAFERMCLDDFKSAQEFLDQPEHKDETQVIPSHTEAEQSHGASFKPDDREKELETFHETKDNAEIEIVQSEYLRESNETHGWTEIENIQRKGKNQVEIEKVLDAAPLNVENIGGLDEILGKKENQEVYVEFQETVECERMSNMDCREELEVDTSSFQKPLDIEKPSNTEVQEVSETRLNEIPCKDGSENSVTEDGFVEGNEEQEETKDSENMLQRNFEMNEAVDKQGKNLERPIRLCSEMFHKVVGDENPEAADDVHTQVENDYLVSSDKVHICEVGAANMLDTIFEENEMTDAYFATKETVAVEANDLEAEEKYEDAELDHDERAEDVSEALVVGDSWVHLGESDVNSVDSDNSATEYNHEKHVEEMPYYLDENGEDVNESTVCPIDEQKEMNFVSETEICLDGSIESTTCNNLEEDSKLPSEEEEKTRGVSECVIVDNDGRSSDEKIYEYNKMDEEESQQTWMFEDKQKNPEMSLGEETIQSSNKEEYKFNKTEEGKPEDNLQRNVEIEVKQHKKSEETREREIEKEREWEKLAVERAIREVRERAFAEARERAAAEKAAAEAQQRLAEARQRLEKASAEAKKSASEKAFMEAKLKAERAAVERATAEARERALEKALSEKAASKARNPAEKFSTASRDEHKGTGPYNSSRYSSSSNQDGSISTSRVGEANGESVQRCKARFERHQRTAERAAKALAEKNMRDLLAQKEQAERNRIAEILDAEVKRWSSGKERNLRALLSTLQYILGSDSGWQPIPLTDLISTSSVKKAYRKATLCVHPDKLQQRGATIHQKYTCEKVFDLLKEAWNKFSAEER